VKSLRIQNIIIRIVAVLVLGIIIWNFIDYLSDTFMGQAYSPLRHFIIALITDFPNEKAHAGRSPSLDMG